MGLLSSLAQNLMDSYYQNYATSDDFFELYHFKYIGGIAYAALLQDEYEKSYKLHAQLEGIPQAELNPEWFIHQKISIKRKNDITQFEAEMPCESLNPVFSFRFDKSNCGIKDIIPDNGTCKDFIRMSFDEKWKLNLLPPSPEIYWFFLGNKVYFSNIRCGLTEATIVYIPSLDYVINHDGHLPDAIEYLIFEKALTIMLQARAGVVIDTSIDGNPNKNIESEINEKFSKMKR